MKEQLAERPRQMALEGQALCEQLGLHPDQSVVSADGKSAIALDSTSKTLLLIEEGNNEICHRKIQYRDLLAVSTVENGVTFTKVERTSQVGAMLLGGVALGGLGALVGGLSAKTVASSHISRLDLFLIINDVAHPTYTLCCLHSGDGNGVDRSSPVAVQAIEVAREWQSILKVLIHQADQQDLADSETRSNSRQVADELVKLADLLDRGLISSDEFEQLKAKLLSK